MKHSVYLPDSLEPLLEHHLNLRQAQFPGTRPRVSAVIADALLAYTHHIVRDYIREHGMTPNMKAKTIQLVEEMEKALGVKFARV